jgi:hypothetical protein
LETNAWPDTAAAISLIILGMGVASSDEAMVILAQAYRLGEVKVRHRGRLIGPDQLRRQRDHWRRLSLRGSKIRDLTARELRHPGFSFCREDLDRVIAATIAPRASRGHRAGPTRVAGRPATKLKAVAAYIATGLSTGKTQKEIARELAAKGVTVSLKTVGRAANRTKEDK